MASLISLLKEVLIKEGGNVFKNTEYDTQNIPLDNIQPTVNKFANDLSKLFPAKSKAFRDITNSNSWLGSTGKKPESGDVDLAFSFTPEQSPKVLEIGCAAAPKFTSFKRDASICKTRRSRYKQKGY